MDVFIKVLMFLFINQPSQETDLIRPDLARGKTSVQRSNSSPSIGVEVGQSSTRIELDPAGGGRRVRCGTIAETERDGADCPQLHYQGPWLLLLASPTLSSAPIPPPAPDRWRSSNLSTVPLPSTLPSNRTPNQQHREAYPPPSNQEH